jgi:hypothetical protein
MTVVGLAVLLLTAAGCGAGKATQDSEPEPDPEPPPSWASLVRELEVVADYGQIYTTEAELPQLLRRLVIVVDYLVDVVHVEPARGATAAGKLVRKRRLR